MPQKYVRRVDSMGRGRVQAGPAQIRRGIVIDNNAIGSMVTEDKEPLLAALTSLSSHSSKIVSSWRTLLKRYGLCSKHMALLSGLHVGPQLRDLIFKDSQAYGEKAERQGQDLARNGVPPECVAVAVALYVECCLPDRKSTRLNSSHLGISYA